MNKKIIGPPKTYRISIHDIEGKEGWTLIEENLTLYELRNYVKDLYNQGYEDDGIFVELEEIEIQAIIMAQKGGNHG